MLESVGHRFAGLLAFLLLAIAAPATAQTPPAQNPPSAITPSTPATPPTTAAPLTPKGPSAAAPTQPSTTKPNASAMTSSPTAARPHRSIVRRHMFRGDVAGFAPGELRAWRGGQWRHTIHAGRHGWWWVVDGGWYSYPAPIYPYPDYVAEEFYEEDNEYAAPYERTEPVTPPYGSYAPTEPYAPKYPSYGSYAPAAPNPYAAAPSYYCDYPPGYYPYV